tara:strand:- start:1192 stop:1773 length:582 start_codon:yes stop_codon:yes gene_type:complete
MIDKNIRFLLLIPLLSSCNSLFSNQSIDYLANYVRGFNDEQIVERNLAESEFTFATVQFGRGPISTVVLAYIEGDTYEWHSADGIKLFTKRGVLTQTLGLESNMKATSFDLTRTNSTSTFTSFDNPDLIFAETFNYISKEINGKNTIYYQEVNIPLIRWSAKNKYVFRNDLPISTEQFVHPHLPKIKLKYYYK